MADFIEDIWGWFVVQPERILTAGMCFFGVGGILCLAGLWGWVATVAVNAVSQKGPKQVNVSLDTLYPGLPIWWIPESFEGLLFAVILIAVGIHLAILGKKIKRLLNYNT